jgi:hypothetical protein
MQKSIVLLPELARSTLAPRHRQSQNAAPPDLHRSPTEPPPGEARLTVISNGPDLKEEGTMKIRAWILAAAIAATTGALTTPTAQACVINADGECLSAVLRSQPSPLAGKHQPTKPTTRPKRHKPPLEP